MDDLEPIRSVVLRRTAEIGLGFSIMGGAGFEFPHVIYGIEKDSAAARSGALEAGDVILSINEREVVKLTTKEVLKCLRLSGDIVNIKFKRDPLIVCRVREFLSIPNHMDSSTIKNDTKNGHNWDNQQQQQNHITFTDDIFINHTNHIGNQTTSSLIVGKIQKSPQQQKMKNLKNGKMLSTSTSTSIQGKKNFETFVMTGDAILNLSRDSNEVFRISPTKTTSKLTPISKSAPPHQIYSDPKPPPTPPLPPPPPPSNSSSSSSSSSSTSADHITVKSDNFPPPPNFLMEDDIQLISTVTTKSQTQTQGFAQTQQSNATCKAAGDLIIMKIIDKMNEDTSISSSVMSDSGEELEEDIIGKEVEKERYNEYILFNGTAEESDFEKIQKSIDSEIELSSDVGAAYMVTCQKLDTSDNSDSDVESMRLPVIKSVDIPSAERLAKRLWSLDGFKSGDVWRQLSKQNEFSRAVAMEYLKYFDFIGENLDVSLRRLLAVCPLRGETQERERVLTYFSIRYIECNPLTYASQDAVHTLACALMLLNTDIYNGGTNRRMNCKDFIQNLSGLNDGIDFPEAILKKLFNSIKQEAIVSPGNADDEESTTQEIIVEQNSKEFKRGYIKRKCIFEPGGKRTPFGRRSWKLHFLRLRELSILLSTDEIKPTQIAIKIHHAYATSAIDYRKKPFILKLYTADGAGFLFQSSDIREMNSWIDNINLNAAKFSAPALEPPCGSKKKFEKPLLPSSVTRMSTRDQLMSHEGQVVKWESELDGFSTPPRRHHSKKESRDRLQFYQHEVRRYRAYIEVLERHLKENSNENDELIELQVLPNLTNVLVELDE